MNDLDHVRAAALPLECDTDLGPVLERIGSARCVLLGEASHGNHEFYAWRAELTRRLIAERGFTFLAVEGDWPDCRDVHRCVTLQKGVPEDPKEILEAYRRWPTWLWANHETVDFCRRLRERNAGLAREDRVGFYGLDIYSLWESLRSVLHYLTEYEPEHVETALAACHCLEPYDENPRAYAMDRGMVPGGCRDEVAALLAELRRTARVEERAGTVSAEERESGTADQAPRPDDRPDGRGADGQDPARRLDALQNAEVAAGAEHYYRTMISGGPEAWNVRDVHMADTLDRLLDFHGPESKAVVWAHNTHIGDSRATTMDHSGMVNLGRLVRERHGPERTVLVGFAGGAGEVIAAPRWGGPTRAMPVPSPSPGSLEALLTEAAPEQALFVLPGAEILGLAESVGRPALTGWERGAELSSPARAGAPGWLVERRGHRAIGVVYEPGRDSENFVPTRLGARYDVLCWFRHVSALRPLHPEAARRGELETMPTGV